MLQFFLGSSGSAAAMSGTADLAVDLTVAVLKVARPLAGDAALALAITGDLQNVPRLNGTVAMTLSCNAPELITPVAATREDELRRRVIKTDVWEFPRRKTEQLL